MGLPGLESRQNLEEELHRWDIKEVVSVTFITLMKNRSTLNLLKPIQQINGYHSRQAGIAKTRPRLHNKELQSIIEEWGH